MKKLTFLIIFLMLTAIQLYAANLKISDPHGWGSDGGTISQMDVTVKPQGLYAEIGVYITFSTEGTRFSNPTPDQNLEIEFLFELPDKAFINDSWLWIEDYISHAYLIDKWSAINIYEGIVKRRKDPSILMKKSANQYELRIYPLLPGNSRKVKINYFIPVDMNNSKLSIDLPFNYLNLSKMPGENYRLFVYTDDQIKNPQLTGQDISFENIYDPVYGECESTSLTFDEAKQLSSLSLSSPMKNGVFFNKSNPGDEGYYQLAFSPSILMDDYKPKKALFIIDRDAKATSLTVGDLMNNFFSSVRSSFMEKDSFNILFSNGFMSLASYNWIPATAEKLDEIEKKYNNNDLNLYMTNLHSSIIGGIEYLQNHGGGDLVIVSASDFGLPVDVVKKLLREVIEKTEGVRIHVVDYQNKGFSSIQVDGNRYYGNQYYYYSMTKGTGGNYYNINKYQNLLSKTLVASYNDIFTGLESGEIYTTTKDGFCYRRFSNEDGLNLTSSLFSEIGRYKGNYPFEVRVTGFYRDDPFIKKITINDGDFNSNNYEDELIWNSRNILDLELKAKDNIRIKELVDESLDNRILCLYTAFLALEENQDPNEPGEEEEEEKHTKAFDEIDNSPVFTASPNPFSQQTRIAINFNNDIKEEVSVKIVDVAGRTIKDLIITPVNNSISFDLNGIDQNGNKLPQGVYMAIIKTSYGTFTYKIIKVN